MILTIHKLPLSHQHRDHLNQHNAQKLDDANIFRFNDLLKIIGENSQIIMITHNKRSMEFADTLFGITMEEKGISKLVSVKFDRGQEAVAV